MYDNHEINRSLSCIADHEAWDYQKFRKLTANVKLHHMKQFYSGISYLASWGLVISNKWTKQ